jgi:DNA-binding LacI/PurR family transcriptional regulator
MDMLRQPKRTPRFSKSPASKIAEMLRDRILSGQYKPGHPIPTGRALQEDLNVDRRVVRLAVSELITEGLLKHKPNCRPHVTRPNLSFDVCSTGQEKNSGRLPASSLIALIMSRGGAQDSTGTVQQRIFWGMIHTLNQAQCHAVFLDVSPTSKHNGPKHRQEADSLNYAIKSGFGGVVFFPQAYDYNREVMQEVSRQIPFVLLDRLVPGVQADVVGVENQKSAYRATSHLIVLGHKRIAFVTSGEWINTVQDRVRGYLQALHKAFPVDTFEMVLTPPSTDTNSWPELNAVAMMPATERPTAFVCVNNNEAVRVARHLAEHGLTVPDDASIIGFDNVQQSLPNGIGLASIAQPFELIGKQAAQLVLRRIQDPTSKYMHLELPTELMLNESVQMIKS